jgi:hypothetical protein
MQEGFDWVETVSWRIGLSTQDWSTTFVLSRRDGLMSAGFGLGQVGCNSVFSEYRMVIIITE